MIATKPTKKHETLFLFWCDLVVFLADNNSFYETTPKWHDFLMINLIALATGDWAEKRTAEFRRVESLRSAFLSIKIDRIPYFDIRHSTFDIRNSLFYAHSTSNQQLTRRCCSKRIIGGS